MNIETPRTNELITRIYDETQYIGEETCPGDWVKLCRLLERELAQAQADAAAMRKALYSADDDIREHLQVCKYNLRGQINTGEIIEKPNPPMLVHEAGIAASERVREKIRAALSSTAGAELLKERDSLRAEVARLREDGERFRWLVEKADIHFFKSLPDYIQEASAAIDQARRTQHEA